MKRAVDIKTIITLLFFSCTLGFTTFTSAENKLPSSPSNNQLTLEDGNLVLNGNKYKVDPCSAIYGGYALGGNAMNNNIVVVSGTYSVVNSIVGGYATGDKKQASNNVITVIGGQLRASIYGGALQAIDGSSACNNIVT